MPWTQRICTEFASQTFAPGSAVWNTRTHEKEMPMIVGNRIPANLPRILISANEPPDLIKFAAGMAQKSKAAILSLYVEPRPEHAINHRQSSDCKTSRLKENAAAQEAFQTTRAICAEVGVPVLQIYTVHNNRGEMLLDHAATWGVDAVVMSEPAKSLPHSVPHEMAFQKVYAELPATISLIIHGH